MTSPVPDALADVRQFLLNYPDVAADASVTVGPDGDVTIQLVRRTKDPCDDKRLGILAGLAASHGGTLTRYPTGTADHVLTSVTWAGRTFVVFAPVAKVSEVAV